MKLRSAILIIVLVIIADQALKIWIKTNYPLGPVTNMFGFSWAKLYFIENEGMAWGWKLGGEWGKMLLTLFRLAAVIFGSWYLGRIVKLNYSRGFIVCAALIYAGALGNLIDSLFYGLIFEESTYTHIAKIFPPQGYGSFLHGKVVDMLYFPFIENGHFPNWIPFIGGDEFTFFAPIFNIADASISIGVIALLLFQKRLLKRHHEESHPAIATSTEVSDSSQAI